MLIVDILFLPIHTLMKYTQIAIKKEVLHAIKIVNLQVKNY